MHRWLCSASALATILALAAAGPTRAQQASSNAPVPPLFPVIDANGVELTSGKLMTTSDVASVGNPGAGQLAWSYQTNSPSPLAGQITDTSPIPTGNIANTLYVTVSIGNRSTKFLGNSSGYYAFGSPDTLTYSNGTFTYTAADGTVAHFTTSITGPQYNMAQITDLTRPDGETLSYTYTYNSAWSSLNGGCTQALCSQIQAVVSNLGYAVHFDYTSTSTIASKITAYNLAYDNCQPSASSCTFNANYQWSYSTLAINSSGGNTTTTVTDALSRPTTYTGSGFTTPAGVATSATYVSDSNSYYWLRVASVTRGGKTWAYNWAAVTDPQFGGSADQVTITDPNGHTRVVVTNRNSGRVESDTDGVGHTTTYTLDQSEADGYRINKVTHPDGSAESYQYDSRGNVTQVTSSPATGSSLPNLITTAVYPSTCSNAKICNKPTSVTVNGKETDYTYDPNSGNIATVTGPAPSAGGIRPVTTYTYAPLYASFLTSSGAEAQALLPVYRLTTVSTCRTQATCTGTSDEIRTTYAYAGNGANGNNLLPSSVTVAAGDITTSHPTSADGSVAATTSYTYDPKGDIQIVDGPRTDVDDTTFDRWDAARQHVGHVDIDPDGQDAGGQAHAERFNYNPDGKLTVNDHGMVAGRSDADWQNFQVVQTTTNTYDATTGLLTQTAESSGGTTYALTQYGYDPAFQLQCTAVRMNPSAFSSLPAACTPGTAGSYGADRISENYYDAAGRLTSISEGVGSSTPRTLKALQYYPNSDYVKTLTDAGSHMTTFTYDGFGRLVDTQYPDPANANTSSPSDYTENTYDPTTGLLSAERRRDGEMVSYTYDGRNRVSAISAPSAGATFSYDNLDRVISATRFGQTVSTNYNALGRVTSTTGPIGTVSYQYDQTGNRTRMTWPDGFYLTYTYNARNQLKYIEENGATSGVGQLVKYTYDGFGRRTVLTRSNGAVTTYTWDAVSRLSSLAVTGTSNNETLNFTYDPAGGIISRTSNNSAYAWNGLYNVNRNYSVDGQNRLTASGGQTLSYGDARGNLTSDGANSYAYDVDNRLTGTGAGASLTYDPADRLYQATSSSGTVTRFLYDGSDMIGEYSSSNTLLQRYVHGPGVDEPLVWYQGSGTSNRNWLIADNQGSIVALTTYNGTSTAPVASINTYDEYGIPGASSPPQSQYAGVSSSSNQGRFQYTGQIWLWEVGLYYYKARVYSPTLGRFLQTDPAGYGAGTNLYAYAENDPVNGTDPTGRDVASNTSAAEDQTKSVLNSFAQVSEVVVTGHRYDAQAESDFRADLRDLSALGNTIVSTVSALFSSHATPTSCAAGNRASSIGEAASGAGTAHDAIKTTAEKIGGKAAGAAFEPLSVTLQVAGAGATFVRSMQRGEPVDVAVVRAGLPAAGSLVGGVGGGLGGAAVGGAAGTVVPILGNGVGAIAGGIAGTVGGSMAGEKSGDAAAEKYAKSRGGC